MKYFPWTTKQLARLKQCYATMSKEDLEREFAPHPYGSICSTAKKHGFQRKTDRNWLEICAAHKPVFDFGRASFK